MEKYRKFYLKVLTALLGCCGLVTLEASTLTYEQIMEKMEEEDFNQQIGDNRVLWLLQPVSPKERVRRFLRFWGELREDEQVEVLCAISDGDYAMDDDSLVTFLEGLSNEDLDAVFFLMHDASDNLLRRCLTAIFENDKILELLKNLENDSINLLWSILTNDEINQWKWLGISDIRDRNKRYPYAQKLTFLLDILMSKSENASDSCLLEFFQRLEKENIELLSVFMHQEMFIQLFRAFDSNTRLRWLFSSKNPEENIKKCLPLWSNLSKEERISVLKRMNNKQLMAFLEGFSDGELNGAVSLMDDDMLRRYLSAIFEDDKINPPVSFEDKSKIMRLLENLGNDNINRVLSLSTNDEINKVLCFSDCSFYGYSFRTLFKLLVSKSENAPDSCLSKFVPRLEKKNIELLLASLSDEQRMQLFSVLGHNACLDWLFSSKNPKETVERCLRFWGKLSKEERISVLKRMNNKQRVTFLERLSDGELDAAFSLMDDDMLRRYLTVDFTNKNKIMRLLKNLGNDNINRVLSLLTDDEIKQWLGFSDAKGGVYGYSINEYEFRTLFELLMSKSEDVPNSCLSKLVPRLEEKNLRWLFASLTDEQRIQLVCALDRDAYDLLRKALGEDVPANEQNQNRMPMLWSVPGGTVPIDLVRELLDGHAVDLSSIPFRDGDVDWFALFWKADLLSRALLWNERLNNCDCRRICDRLNGKEMSELLGALDEVGCRKLFEILGKEEWKKLLESLDDAGQAALIHAISDENFRELCRYVFEVGFWMNQSEFVCAIQLLDRDSDYQKVFFGLKFLLDEREVFWACKLLADMIKSLNENDMRTFITRVSGQDFDVIVKCMQGRCDGKETKSARALIWSGMSDDQCSRLISSLDRHSLGSLFEALEEHLSRECSRLVRYLDQQKIIQLFFEISLDGSVDRGRVFLWNMLDKRVQRILWEIMDILKSKNADSEQLNGYLEKCNLPNARRILPADKEYFSNDQANFLYFLDYPGWKRLIEILNFEECIPLYLTFGHDQTIENLNRQRVLLWHYSPEEWRVALANNKEVQGIGPDWLLSGQGDIVQWYQNLKGLEKYRLLHCLDDESVKFLKEKLSDEEFLALVWGCALREIFSNRTVGMTRVFSPNVNISYQTAWSRMSPKARAYLFDEMFKRYSKNFEYGLGHVLFPYLRREEVAIRDLLGAYNSISFDDWEKLDANGRVNAFWLLSSNDQERAYLQLNKTEQARVFKHLSDELKRKYWDLLTPEGKKQNWRYCPLG